MPTAPAPPLGESLDQAPFTKLHFRFWLLAALGILLDGFDFFIIGVASPLLAEDFGLSDAEKGLVTAAAIVGAIFGAGLLGPLADKIGRRRIFRFDLILFIVFSLICMLAWNVWSLIAFRFVLGIAIGLDYPIAASYLAEVLPSRARGRWLVSAFSLQAIGILMGAIVGVIVLAIVPEVTSWRWMLGFGAIPALVIVILRRGVPESPRWLAQNGREEEAAEVTEALVCHPVTVTAADRAKEEETPEGIKALVQPRLFKRGMRRRTAFTALPWFLMDIATYGVGIFTPTLIAAIAVHGANTTFIADDIASTKATAALDIFLPIGFAIAIYLVDRVGRVPLQIFGFAGMTVALCLLATIELLSGGGESHLALVAIGFAIFNTCMNAGPNATTYALPAEVFPSEVRAAGHGFAAACAKFGAALGVFFFPILLADIGASALLFGVAGCCLLGLTITAALRIEPKGRTLEDLAGAELSELAPHPVPP
ncbi:MAG TPA: MFS transporter [Solirubrobacterales bacterium]|nr:MFS transporter [Solirubrobacterales bacterium]